MPRKSSLLIVFGVLASLIIAAVSYFWTTGAIDSLYAFRSPLTQDPPAPGPALDSPLTRRVVFVLIDGLRNDTANDASVMPFLAELRARGASATVHSRPPSFSAPSYTVLFTGAWPDISDGPAVNLDYDDYWAWTQDNLFSAVHRAGGRTAISGYYWFEKLVPQDAVADHFYTPGEDAAADRQVVDAALPWLKGNQHQLVLIHLDQVDHAGHHEGGPINPNWNAAASRADGLLREIVTALDLSQDAVLVTSDHGHLDTGNHGGPEPVLLLQPLVLAGAGVQPGEYGDTQQVDTAPTLAALLGLNVPASSQGTVLAQMLALSASRVAEINQAVASQQNALVNAYATSIGWSQGYAAGAPPNDINRLNAIRNEKLTTERIPRLVVVLALLVAVAVIVWQSRSRALGWALIAALAYLIVFNVRYALLSHRTYSLTSVTGANELIFYVLVTALLAFVVAWLVFVLGTRLFFQPSAQAARLTLGLGLLTLGVVALPALFSFVWNGPLITWTLPEMWSFFLGFLGTLQALFIALFGILFAGLAALVTRFTRPPMRPS